MADFFQNGVIATLHNLGSRSTDDLERELVEWSVDRPMALVIPSLHDELAGPALSDIVDEVSKIPYLAQVIIGLDRATEEQFGEAREFFSRLPQSHRLLWNDGPRLREIDSRLAEHGLAPTQEGKGRNVWYCLGYYLASGPYAAVALHDADVLTYDRSMVARLLYPVVHPTFGYAFSKGYYHRAGDGRMNGRVVRLLVTPLVRALRRTIGPNEHLDYIDSFRYPLAGEFAMHTNVVRPLRIPSDWGLEIGLLAEVIRRYTGERICQVEIADAYDHKHQDMSFDDPNSGLHKMSIDISKALFRKLAIGGEVFSPETFRTVKASYYREALQLIDAYHNDAVLNGLTLDRHAEEAAVELFAQAIMEAGDQFLSNPMEQPFVPSWSRVMSAVPDILEQLRKAVEADNAE